MNYFQKSRRKKFLTQQDVEELTGIDTATLSLYENGLRMPTVENAKKLGSVYDVPWTKFFEEDEDDKN